MIYTIEGSRELAREILRTGVIDFGKALRKGLELSLDQLFNDEALDLYLSLAEITKDEYVRELKRAKEDFLKKSSKEKASTKGNDKAVKEIIQYGTRGFYK